MLVLGLLQQREQNMILATAVKWNGKPDLELITHWNTSLMCGKCSHCAILIQTPHKQLCLIAFVKGVFLLHG